MAWSSLRHELRLLGADSAAAVPLPANASLEERLAGLERDAALRSTQDLPVHAVLAGWRGECASWKGEITRLARVTASAEPMPRLGWFEMSQSAQWWPQGAAVDPSSCAWAESPAARAWGERVRAAFPTWQLSPVPDLDELNDPTVRLGLAVIHDGLGRAVSRSADVLHEMLVHAFTTCAGEALAGWYENRGAAPLEVVDELRLHIEFTACRRYYVEQIAAFIESVVTEWGQGSFQPALALDAMTPGMVAVAA